MSFVACNEQCRDASLHQTVRIREVTNMKSLNHWKSIVSLVVLTCLLAVPVSALGKKGKDHFNRGMKYEQAQQWEKAAQEFTLAVAADPSNVEAAYDLELLLRLTAARGSRIEPGQGGGFGRTGHRGAGGGQPGSGY